MSARVAARTVMPDGSRHDPAAATRAARHHCTIDVLLWLVEVTAVWLPPALLDSAAGTRWTMSAPGEFTAIELVTISVLPDETLGP
jgi:hypothetical protein